MLAARGYEVSKMGYLGVDIVLDRHLGPLLLELNARPGLAIQVANGRGLRPRLDFIDKAPTNLLYKDRVNFVLEHWDQ